MIGIISPDCPSSYLSPTVGDCSPDRDYCVPAVRTGAVIGSQIPEPLLAGALAGRSEDLDSLLSVTGHEASVCPCDDVQAFAFALLLRHHESFLVLSMNHLGVR